jgi:hypothetical protein
MALCSLSPDISIRVDAREDDMNELIYLVGLVVVVMFILGALGLR